MTLTLPDRIPGILSPEFEADPYSAYVEMRDKAPIYYYDQLQAYVLSRYAAVSRAFKDPAFTNKNYE